MIKNWQASAGALALSEEGVRKTERRTIIFFRSIALILTLMCVLLLAWGGWELLVAWRTGQAEDWRDFWENARSAPLFFPLLIFFAVPSIWRLTFEAMRRVIETRQAAVSGDDARSARQGAT